MEFNNSRTYPGPKYGTSPSKTTNKSSQVFALCQEYFEQLNTEKIEEKFEKLKEYLSKPDEDETPEIPIEKYTEYYLKQRYALSSEKLACQDPLGFGTFASVHEVDRIFDYKIYNVEETQITTSLAAKRSNKSKNSLSGIIRRDISAEIKQLEKELAKQTKANKAILKNIKCETDKKRVGNEIEPKPDSTHNLLYLKLTVEKLELKQIAESLVQVYSRRLLNKKKGKASYKPTYEYKILFDESVRIPPLWVNQEILAMLNGAKTSPLTGINEIKADGKKRDIKKYWKQTEENGSEYGFCHQCKQNKPKVILASCSYNSADYGHAVPSFMLVKNIKAFNVEPYNTQAINYAIANCGFKSKNSCIQTGSNINDSHCQTMQGQFCSQKEKLDRKKTKISRNKRNKCGSDKKSTGVYNQDMESSKSNKKIASHHNANFEYYECNRMYCSFCLKIYYDLSLSDCKSNWICPFCQGICHCSRCTRQDQLVKMKALLFSEGGNLDHLFESPNKIHQIIAENYVRTEKLMYNITDEGQKPPSPIKPVKKSVQLNFACDSTSESLQASGCTTVAQELQELEEKRDRIVKMLESVKKIKQDEKYVLGGPGGQARATEALKIAQSLVKKA
ncbi:unnamed protein product [Moneuplotes crassus]|uniref:Zinc-finger domain-containing protein n=1 Tax=Euplotes crassus TaxID=5936 RepID=A0AAD1YA96_EUPCR|nr:unnamed protein product [Moneuplotes crassus]